MLTIELKKAITSQVLKNPKIFYTEIEKILTASALHVLAEYKRQTPTDTGILRGSITINKTGRLSYTVGILSGKLRQRLLYLYHGTGKYKGTEDAGYTTGRTRATNFYGFGSRAKAANFFRILRGRGRVLSIKPNKIAYRAYKNTLADVNKIFKKEIKKIL